MIFDGFIAEINRTPSTSLKCCNIYRTIPKGIVGSFFLDFSISRKSEKMVRGALLVCLRVQKESNKSRFDSYSVRNSALIITQITFRDCGMHFFPDNLSQNSCIGIE